MAKTDIKNVDKKVEKSNDEGKNIAKVVETKEKIKGDLSKKLKECCCKSKKVCNDILMKISFSHIKADVKRVNISKEGKATIIIMLTATVVSFIVFGLGCLATIFLFLTALTIYFFRDPIRVLPEKQNVIVSPCDGKILKIETANLPSELGAIEQKEYTKISVFMNIMDVHMQRVPVDCKVKQIEYIKGTFINATLDKASTDNERNIVLFERENGDSICVVQISGFISRRIVCCIEKDQICKKGDKYGMIKFGSRVEIYLPKNYKVEVLAGQRVVSGETIVASF